MGKGGHLEKKAVLERETGFEPALSLWSPFKLTAARLQNLRCEGILLIIFCEFAVWVSLELVKSVRVRIV